MPRWLPHPLVLFSLPWASLLFAAFLSKGPWDSDFYWHAGDRTPHRVRQLPDDRPVLLHVGRDAVDPARVAGRADHLHPRRHPRIHGRRPRLRARARHRHGDPGLRAASARAAHPCRHRRAPRLPRSSSSPTPRSVRRPCPGSCSRSSSAGCSTSAPTGALGAAAPAVLRPVGEPARSVGRGPRGPRRLRGDDPLRHDADVAGEVRGRSAMVPLAMLGDDRSRQPAPRSCSTRSATSTLAIGAWRTSPSGSPPTSTIRHTSRCCSSWQRSRSSAAGACRGG